MEEIKIIHFQCTRCKHTWIPRDTKKPKVCPNCNSPYWNKERGWYKMKKKKEDQEWIGEKTEMAYYSPSKKQKN